MTLGNMRDNGVAETMADNDQGLERKKPRRSGAKSTSSTPIGGGARSSYPWWPYSATDRRVR
jgi:hypothetical protein